MANPYQSVKRKPAGSNDRIHIYEWLVIIAFLIVLAIAYSGYIAYKNAHVPAPDQPVATGSMNHTAANTNGPAQPNP